MIPGIILVRPRIVKTEKHPNFELRREGKLRITHIVHPQHTNARSRSVNHVEPNLHENAVCCHVFNPIDLKIGMEVCLGILHLDANFQVDRIKNVAMNRILEQVWFHGYSEWVLWQ